MPNHESEPLLPAPVTHSHPLSATATSPTTRSKLNARRMSTGPLSAPPLIGGASSFGMSEKSRGKQRAREGEDVGDNERKVSSGFRATSSPGKRRTTVGRHVTVIFSGDDGGGSEGNLDLWVEDGESVGAVKEQIRHLRPGLAGKSLRLIHSGRLLTDGILLLGWLRSLEERVKRQTGGVGRDVESVLKDVGLAEEEDGEEGEMAGSGHFTTAAKKEGAGRVWLHCVVGGKTEEPESGVKEDEPTLPRRRGFDVLLDAGLSAADVAAMRRQFYESRGEEVPEDMGETNDEHARALEEQWIEGDMTAETAATSTEGMFSSTLHGLLAGFLFPIMPWFFFREIALPNFFDADAEAAGDDPGGINARVAENAGAGLLPSVVFGKRMQVGILFGTILNLAFGALRFLN